MRFFTRRAKPSSVIPPFNTLQYALPDAYRVVAIKDESGRDYRIVVDVQPKTYDQIVIAGACMPGNALILARLAKSGTLVDLGANIGTVCIPCAIHGLNIIAVEMLPQNCAKLIHGTLVNKLPNIRISQSAATEFDGLVGYEGDEAWGVVSNSKIAAQCVGLKLDTIINQLRLSEPSFLREPFVMKIDIEGHEFPALKGATQFLDQHRPVVLIESIETPDPDGTEKLSKRFLAKRGYDLFLIRNDIFVPRNADDPQESLVSDFLAIPREKNSSTRTSLAGFEFRDLLDEEIDRWLSELRADENPLVSAHARSFKRS